MLEAKIKNVERFFIASFLSFGLYSCSGFSCSSEAIKELRKDVFDTEYCSRQVKKHGYCKRPYEYELFSFKLE